MHCKLILFVMLSCLCCGVCMPDVWAATAETPIATTPEQMSAAQGQLPAAQNQMSVAQEHTPAATEQVPVASPQVPSAAQRQPADVWLPLITKLQADGLWTDAVQAIFVQFGAHVSPDPMGRKIHELYSSKFLPKKPRKPMAVGAVYPDVITAENVQRCRAFLVEHKAAFLAAQKKYGVPPQIAVALLFVETRLGTYLGKQDALYTLASMAASTQPDAIAAWFPRLPGYEAHIDWIQQIMPQRAAWAYNELKALLRFIQTQGGVSTMPGSIYGAIGLCQFMPSNLKAYGDDGNGDGKVDLFLPADAIASLACFLHKHGWRGKMTLLRQHRVLKKYNNSTRYANTILALGRAVAGEKQKKIKKK